MALRRERENFLLFLLFLSRHALYTKDACVKCGKNLKKVTGDAMPYKLDGAKFETLEDLVEALYPIYSSEMSEEEFKKYCEEHAEKT